MIRLTITMDADGRIQIHGPIENRVLCYGLLGIAHDLVKDHDPQKIQIPQNGEIKRVVPAP